MIWSWDKLWRSSSKKNRCEKGTAGRGCVLGVTVGPVFRYSSHVYPCSEAGDAGDLGVDGVSPSRLCVIPGLARAAEEVACAVAVLLSSCRDIVACS